MAEQPTRGRVERLSLDELAAQTGVEAGYVRRLVDLGVLEEHGGDTPYRFEDARRVRLLEAWERAGLSLEAVASAVAAGELSFTFLDTPALSFPARLNTTYEELSTEKSIPLGLVQSLHVALGHAPPHPSDPVPEDDLVLVELLQMVLEAGIGEEPALRLFRVYANSLHRLAKAEAELYEAEVEERLRGSGVGEQDLLDHSAELGERLIETLERALIIIYRRHREHVWIEHSVNHGEAALEAKGLYRRVERPPCIAFVDLTGFTRLTEEQGDRVAARIAASLASLVEDISREHRGQPIRWLGDGGMFLFEEPGAAVHAGLEMTEQAPRRGLPPTHIGIHRGPVIFQDGDVYGRTVNLAARIAAQAGAGEVLVSEETARGVRDDRLRLEEVGPADLKGLARPVVLFRAMAVGDPPKGGS